MGDMIGKPARAVFTDADDGNLGGASADIEKHDRTRFRPDERRATGDGKSRFGLAVDNLQLQSRFGGDALEEGLAIVSRAASFGRDQPHAADLTRLQLGGADAQRFDGPVHGIAGQPSTGAKPLAETHDSRECIDDPELPRARRLRDQQAAIVGAEIKRSIKVDRTGIAFGMMMLRMPLAPRHRLPVMAMILMDLHVPGGKRVRRGDNLCGLLMRQWPALQAAFAAVLAPVLAALVR